MQVIRQFRFWEKKEIEAIAHQVLVNMGKEANYRPKWPLDSSRVAEFLGLDVVWDKIAPDEQGNIAARILPLEHLIEINEDILEFGHGFGESTLAHEIGHWVLHIDQKALYKYCKLTQQGVQIESEFLVCRNQKQLRGMEWQAQYFATCLLMPKSQVEIAVKDKNLENWRHLYKMASELGVTISNLLHRLKDLGWIQVNPDSRTIERI